MVSRLEDCGLPVRPAHFRPLPPFSAPLCHTQDIASGLRLESASNGARPRSFHRLDTRRLSNKRSLGRRTSYFSSSAAPRDLDGDDAAVIQALALVHGRSEKRMAWRLRKDGHGARPEASHDDGN